MTLLERGDVLAGRAEVVLGHRFSAWLLGGVICASLAAFGSAIGTARYSPDSWAYFELARTVFHGDFYRFTTYRSYFTDTYSASFPPGLPVLLACLHEIFGARPWVQVPLNAVLAGLTAVCLCRIGGLLRLPAIAGWAVATALCLYPYYVNEVVAGRAIPLAILCFALSTLACLRGQPVVCGLLLGAAVLVRFDYLAFALLFQGGVFLLSRRRFRDAACIGAGFLVGILPWVIYSETHFGVPWITDNAWVVRAASPAYVLDFPAVAQVSAAEDPAAWRAKLLGNVLPLGKALAASLLSMPVAFGLLLVVAPGVARLPPAALARFGILAAILLAALLPYLLTGYFDLRYFAQFWLCAVLAALMTTRWKREGDRERALALKVWGVLLVTVPVTPFLLAKEVSLGFEQATSLAKDAEFLSSLAACHAQHPEATYIFNGSAKDFAPQYGATLRMRAAMAPSNFSRMDETTQTRYLRKMSPYVLINERMENFACPIPLAIH